MHSLHYSYRNILIKRGTHKYSTNEQYLKLKSYDKDLYEQLKKGCLQKELEEKRISYKNEIYGSY